MNTLFAGNRKFGIYNSTTNPCEFAFYIIGVDRTWDVINATINRNDFGFEKADELWNNVQDNFKFFINQNGGQANFYTPKNPHARPDYNAVKDYLEGKISKDSLSIRLGCI